MRLTVKRGEEPEPSDRRGGAIAELAAGAVGDADLVRRAQAGDRWAEEALYRRHVRPVTTAVTRLLGRVGEADDVIQETFARAFERIGSLRDGAAFRMWVIRVAVSLCRRRFRRRRLLALLGLDRGEDDGTLASCVAPDAPPDVVLELRDIDRALASLSEAARAAWILHRVEGLTLPETAVALEVSLATAKRRLAEADARIAPLRHQTAEEP
jgi:RNA polymerase sigma-70 factor (ECF subfamily)